MKLFKQKNHEIHFIIILNLFLINIFERKYEINHIAMVGRFFLVIKLFIKEKLN